MGWILCWKNNAEALPVLAAYAKRVVERDAVQRLRKPLGYFGKYSGKAGLPSLKYDPLWLERLREGWLCAGLKFGEHEGFRATITALQLIWTERPVGVLSRCVQLNDLKTYMAGGLVSEKAPPMCPSCTVALQEDGRAPQGFCALCGSTGWLGNEASEVAARVLGASVRIQRVSYDRFTRPEWLKLLRDEEATTRRLRGLG